MPKKAGNIVGNLISLPPNMARAGWDIDTDVLRRFCKEFGVKWDITFRYSAGQYTVGSHRVERIGDGRFRHRITLSQDRDETFALNTILHELRHAIQAENEMVGENPIHFYATNGGAYTLEKRRHGYRYSSFEIDARDFAKNEAEKWSELIY